MAGQLGIASRVTFLGEVSESQLRILLHAADVFVLPSIDRREAFGITQLEAMACGKPVVSSDLPTGMRCVNRHGMSGILVSPGDPQALAEALQQLLDDVGLRARLGCAARARVEQEFTAERMIARTLEVYHEDYEINRQILLRQGVPPEAITILAKEIVNTWDELGTAVRWLEKHGSQRVIIVTSKSHTRRVTLMWRHWQQGAMCGVVRWTPGDPFDPRRAWWKDRGFAIIVSGADELLARISLVNIKIRWKSCPFAMSWSLAVVQEVYTRLQS